MSEHDGHAEDAVGYYGGKFWFAKHSQQQLIYSKIVPLRADPMERLGREFEVAIDRLAAGRRA